MRICLKPFLILSGKFSFHLRSKSLYCCCILCIYLIVAKLERIDRLVKEDDTCVVWFFCDENYPKQDIRSFLVQAKNSTYTVGDFEYFSGEEKIYCKQEKVYFCTFHGGVIG